MLDTNHNFYSKIQNTGNYLIVKDDVGKSKPNTRTLPSNSFSYGIKVSKDNEDAGAVISSWAETAQKPYKPIEQDFKKLNMMSITEKQVTAPQQRKFRKTAQCRRLSSEEPRIFDDGIQTIYGMALRPSTPIKAVLSNFYGNVALEEKHYAYSDKMKTSSFRKRSVESDLKKPKIENQKVLFKMKKFLKVRARTSTRRNRSFIG
ncbi:hypothetical protein SteCoe_24812 [Stentor coeruleus]|uniref:Uncharacterized protein n=1 Tax=Stentor coeruleus TaxID=5963 RepID=A0A1R2BGL0_9CILI|nr:hypothetical protein SteCoe_24812 [Stentor coeruleus]